MNQRNELEEILGKFVASGWDIIAEPAQKWLAGTHNKPELTAAVKQADNACGSCGCELDPLYKRALQLLLLAAV